MDDSDIQAAKDDLARRRAWLEQHEKEFEDQYAFMRPRLNKLRLDILELWKFRIEIDEWELEQLTKDFEEDEDS